MKETSRQSTQKRVVESYFETTSGTNKVMDQEAYQKSLHGLRRRLGPWLDVAGQDVVDLGSGTGQLCVLARQGGARRVVGVNMSQGEIDFSRQVVKADFVLMDICTWLAKQQAGSIDRIFALNILEHLDKNQLVNVLEEACRCLRPDGFIVAMVPNAISPFGSMTRYWDITHQNAFTPSSIQQLARLTGFGETAEFRECGPVPYGLISGIRYVLWRCLRLLIKSYLMVELADSKGGVYTADLLFKLIKGR